MTFGLNRFAVSRIHMRLWFLSAPARDKGDDEIRRDEIRRLRAPASRPAASVHGAAGRSRRDL